MKILICDDETAILDVICEYGNYLNYQCVGVNSSKKAVELALTESFDVIVMDIMMPDLDGYSATKLIKAEKDIPIILVSARNEEKDKLLGFEKGANDYLTKPFSIKELFARIQVLGKKESINKLIIKNKLVVDEVGRKVTVNGQLIHLSLKEYELLLVFVKKEGYVLSREQLLSLVWKNDPAVDDRIVDVYIKRLRQSLFEIKHYFVTIRGVGYKFEIS